MVLYEREVLQILTIITTINGLHFSSQFQHNSLEILSKYFDDNNSRSPLVVVISSADQARIFDDEITQDHSYSSAESYDPHRSQKTAKLQSTNDIYNALIRGNNQDNRILRAGEIDENDSDEQLEQETMIADALRSRCEARVECEEKCPKKETKKECSESSDNCETTEKCSGESDPCSVEKKPEKNCPKSCKAVFDDLIKCPPPGNKKKPKKKKKEDKGCATGKTLPPSWGNKDDKYCH